MNANYTRWRRNGPFCHCESNEKSPNTLPASVATRPTRLTANSHCPTRRNSTVKLCRGGQCKPAIMRRGALMTTVLQTRSSERRRKNTQNRSRYSWRSCGQVFDRLIGHSGVFFCASVYNGHTWQTCVGNVESAGSSSVFRVVVNEHVVGTRQQRTVHIRRRRYRHLHHITGQNQLDYADDGNNEKSLTEKNPAVENF